MLGSEIILDEETIKSLGAPSSIEDEKIPQVHETIFNSSRKRAELYHEIQYHIGLLSDSPIGKAHSFVKSGTHTVKNTLVQAAKTYSGWDYLEDDEVPWYRKIVPTFGAILGCITGIPAMIAMALPQSQLIAPIMCVASLAKMVHDATFLRQEYVERKYLRKDLKSRANLQKQMDKSRHYKKLSLENKEKVAVYAFGQRSIYEKLYAFRQNIITDPSFNREEKEQLVQLVNQLIEKFSRQEEISFDSPLFSKEIKEEKHKEVISSLEKEVRVYNIASEGIKNQSINVGRNLRHGIDRFKITQDRIHAQDLPQSVKDDIQRLIEERNLSQVEIQIIYAKIGNHFLNITTKEQVTMQDQSYELDVIRYFHSDEEISKITDYYKLPRKIFDILREIKLKIEVYPFEDDDCKKATLDCINHVIKNYIDKAELSEDDIETIADVENYLESLGQLGFEDFNETLNNSKINFETIFERALSEVIERDRENLEALKDSLVMHRLCSLQQYASGIELQFEGPHIAFGDKKNNLILQAEEIIKNTALAKIIKKAAKKIKAELKDVKQKIGDNLTEVILGEEELHDKQVKREAKKRYKESQVALDKQFAKSNHSAVKIFERANKLAILEVTAPRRWVSLGLDAGIFGLNLAGTITVAAAAAPGAQPVVIATSVISAASTALTVATLANDIDLALHRYNKEQALEKHNVTLKEGIKADVQHERKQRHAAQKALLTIQKKSKDKKSVALNADESAGSLDFSKSQKPLLLQFDDKKRKMPRLKEITEKQKRSKQSIDEIDVKEKRKNKKETRKASGL